MEREKFVRWRARMLYPCREGSEGPGHYDLQLLGRHVFDGVTYVDPVFSYGREGSAGFLAIFDGSASVAYYRDYLPFRAYAYRGGGASTDGELRAFLDRIRGSVDADGGRFVEILDARGERAGRYCRYAIRSAYGTYDLAARNCYTAVGLWMRALGDGRFADFAAEHPYTDYMARPMLRDHPSLWELAGTYE